MKKILVLGGTNFIGRVLVEQLVNTEHEVVLFNRGKTHTELFPQLRKISGDRETDDIKQIFQEDWDIIFDLSAYYPLTMEKLLNGLKNKTGKYVFVSSISACDLDSDSTAMVTDYVKLLSCSEEEKTDKNLKSYGQRKAECERVLLEQEGLEKIILRPGLVYGKYDPTDRFYYWLYRVKTQHEILVPENGKILGTYTFVEDLVKIMLNTIDKNGLENTYNVVTHDPASLKEILDISSEIMNTNPEYINASNDFLDKHNIQQWFDLPLWIKESERLFDNSNVKKDFAITFENFDDSIKKTISYYDDIGWNEGKYGLSLAKEKELISEIT